MIANFYTHQTLLHSPLHLKLFPGDASGKEPPANAGDVRDMGLIPGLERSLAGMAIHSLQYSCPENPLDRGAWPATVHGVKELDTAEVT